MSSSRLVAKLSRKNPGASKADLKAAYAAALETAQAAGDTDEVAAGAAWLVTMGCGEQCPVVPGARVIDWPLADPKGRPIDEVRAIRDEIRQRVETFVDEQGWRGGAAGGSSG